MAEKPAIARVETFAPVALEAARGWYEKWHEHPAVDYEGSDSHDVGIWKTYDGYEVRSFVTFGPVVPGRPTGYGVAVRPFPI